MTATETDTARRQVWVTGVSRGLGLAIAARLLDEGHAVLGLGRRPGGFAALAEAMPERAAFAEMDLSAPGAIGTIARDLLRIHGTPWGLVNNAAVGLDGVLATQHQSDIERLIATNLTGPITLTKFVCRAMLARSEGRIVNISSIIASTGFHGLSVYAASKAGLEGFTRSLARELGKRGVTANCVAPGYMETEMTAGLAGGRLEQIRRRAPLGLAAPEDAAAAVAYLIGPGGAKVTGTVLTVDGGSTA
ncbi:SDR family NAD(P)-dependent oxidoreductase [Paralimibaculum aggregatum]|uniref:SDR family NAD(P)-dependent oxidoreductase n=1 Tax=Paralimibaculum aggregatum TaxID=3036245 RepID=A0ABQ6LMC9_9RHOB|nr:SDR family NAD(P)-dependent oxidoreductase [Limibaculum sp. NKW23]GMG84362.1 SDR family NAD(P)-dependent oxidoreductase [Limibaculum sp. NKW23]